MILDPPTGYLKPLELGQEKNENLKWPQFKWPVTPQKVQHDTFLFFQIDGEIKTNDCVEKN